ncbi:MAG: transporter [Sphingomonas bacterium]|nr:transporter [Sphingomonas bacterium]
METAEAQPGVDIGAARARLVIAASSIGTVFEWYDFFIYGTLAPIIGRLFFPAGNETAQFLLALASFGVGFGMRPIGAALFGYLGDRLGRKYTFLVTVTVMGLATAGVGLVPSYAQIGMTAPVVLILLRVAQGLALGGEYGGATIYVAEHAPKAKRGFYTSFIQASVIGGFLLSLIVVLSAQASISTAAWDSWGWRIPFLFSLLLLAVSLWMRLKLSESPVFKAMKAAGRISRNPLRESFSSRENIKMMAVATFGVAAGLTVIWYTAQFGALYFLQNARRLDDTWARVLIGIGAVISLFWFILFGSLSDRIGRKPSIVLGYALTLAFMFPLFHLMAMGANPGLEEAARRSPVVVSGPDCRYHPFSMTGQPTECGRILDHLSSKGVSYTKVRTPGVALVIGGRLVTDRSSTGIDAALTRGGWSVAKVKPTMIGAIEIVLAVVGLGLLSGMTYGPVAALLAEMFPARVRYSSMSIPYHIGTGYFGGFLPFISQYIVARTGDPFAGLWYTFAVVALALVVTIFWLPETLGRDLD